MNIAVYLLIARRVLPKAARGMVPEAVRSSVSLVSVVVSGWCSPVIYVPVRHISTLFMVNDILLVLNPLLTTPFISKFILVCVGLHRGKTLIS